MSDFEFSFDPALFPNPPPLPPSADLFSPAETTDLLGFLDAFRDFTWDIHDSPDHPSIDYSRNALAPYSNPHLNTTPDPSTRRSDRQRSNTASDTSSPVVPAALELLHSSSSSSTSTSSQLHLTGRTKPLLSTPQKRINHIMSEQKRRNAIRDGYAQLIALLSPEGSSHAINMPTRGRPKGSGSRGKGQSKGKSGVLFRAVEYCRWLEEGRDALREEVARVEAAAGIRHH
ncbi:hypothetical protein APHAL10511_005993 [Amanita phalloides]|nr:hypothetical protein APHAL10511_005993 [Amanita phalloides]